MNKKFKGALAGTAGVALLAGGFGSFALWSDQEALPGGQVNSGHLMLATGATSWTDISPDAANTIWDAQNDYIVPGDVVKMTQELDIRALGKNLNGELKLDTGALDLTAFAGYLDVDMTVLAPGFTPKAGTTNVFEFDADNITSGMVNVEVVFTFDQNTPNQIAQNATATLNDATIDLYQVRNGASGETA